MMAIDEKAFSSLTSILNQFTVMPDNQISALRTLVSKASYKKHEYFTKVGDEQTHIGFVLDGLFRLFYVDLKGKEYTKNFMMQHHFVAPYNSVLSGKQSNLYIQALKDSEVLLINYAEGLKLADSHSCWQILLRKITESAYLQKEKRESDLLFYDAQTRYTNFINEFPDLRRHIKQQHLATFLGMSPETLSRIKKSKIDKSQ